MMDPAVSIRDFFSSQFFSDTSDQEEDANVEPNPTRPKRRGGLHYCSWCSKRFRKPCLLRRHEVVHMLEKPYECVICSQRFTQKSSLQRHEAHNHRGERKHKCPKCQLSFAQRTNLLTHLIRTHPSKSTKNKGYACSQCSCIFTKLNALNRHKAAQHTTSEIARSFQEDQPVGDADLLARNVLEQLKCLQSGMESPAKEVEQQEELESNGTASLPTTNVDDANINFIIFYDKLNPNKEAKLSCAQRVTRADGSSHYICGLCSKEFRMLYNFIRHHRTHTKERPFKCSYCESSFTVNDKLVDHTKIHILEETTGIISKQHSCGICDKKYASVKQLDEHMSTHTSTHTLVYVCSLCRITFASKASYSRHKHRSPDKELDMLQKFLPEPINLIPPGKLEGFRPDKSATYQLRRFQCSICGMKLATTAHLKQHEYAHTKKKPFQCGSCRKFFSSISARNAHQKIHSGHQPYTCTHCPSPRSFTTKIQLRRHFGRVHSKQRNFQCVYCRHLFFTKDDCRRHMKTHLQRLLGHNNDSQVTAEPLAVAEQEPPTLPEPAVVVNELAQTTSAKFIELQMLPKCERHEHRNFTIEHLRKDTALPPPTDLNVAIVKHSCSFCQKPFKKPSDLQRHLRTHTQERPFACALCDKRFALKSTAEEHYLTHLAGARSKFVCQVCSKEYASKKVLVVHQRIHTGTQPFKCDHCEKTFRTSGHRISHMKTGKCQRNQRAPL